MSVPCRPTISAGQEGLSGEERYQRFLEARLRRTRAMASHQAITATHVQTILKDLDRLTGRDGDWRVEPTPIRGRDSWVFKAHTPLAPWPLAVKTFCTAVSDDQIIVQSNHLRGFKSMGGCPELTVPAFWAILPEHRTLVMEWIEEPRMDELLRRIRSKRDERSRVFAAAGRWLRHYHSQSKAVMRVPRLKSYSDHVDILLGGEEGAGHHVRDAVFRDAYEALVGYADAMSRGRVIYVMAHGDFVPHNVFHGDGRTVGFDMVPRIRPALRDVCHFLVHAEIKKPFMTLRATLGPTGIERQDMQAFLDAYGLSEHHGSDAFMAYTLLNETLVRWAVVVSHLRRGGRLRPEHLISWLRYRRMAKSAARILRYGLRIGA